jgi:Fe-S-cluster containining protein
MRAAFGSARVLERRPSRAIMKLVIDPIEVQRLAEELEDENWVFRGWLKSNPGLDDDELMSVVHWLAEDVTAQIDCTACGNCCRVLAPLLDEEDMQRLAQALEMDIPSLQRTTLRQEERGHWELPAPCPLQDGNLCRVYDARPKLCREYPHLHSDFRRHRMARLGDTFVCPIVFNVVEGMKVEFDWHADDALDWLEG